MFHPEKNLSFHFQSPKIHIFGTTKGEPEAACCSKWKSGKEQLQLLRAGFVPKTDRYKLTGFAGYSSWLKLARSSKNISALQSNLRHPWKSQSRGSPVLCRGGQSPARHTPSPSAPRQPRFSNTHPWVRASSVRGHWYPLEGASASPGLAACRGGTARATPRGRGGVG